MGASEEGTWWDRNLTIAVITATAAILGAGVGAGATYYGNRSLQEEQSEATARGIARVLRVQLAAAEARLKIALERNYLILPDPATSVALSQNDEQLLAANLDADSWTKVAFALFDLQLEQEESALEPANMPALEANAGRRVPLDQDMREDNEAMTKSLKAAFKALEPLANG